MWFIAAKFTFIVDKLVTSDSIISFDPTHSGSIEKYHNHKYKIIKSETKS